MNDDKQNEGVCKKWMCKCWVRKKRISEKFIIHVCVHVEKALNVFFRKAKEILLSKKVKVTRSEESPTNNIYKHMPRYIALANETNKTQTTSPY